ncbi:protein phosphatase PP2A regulatory subunit A, putative [Plasmodium chabaudi adami]|uniref:Protein phosphatase PP2A regulatory subunit A, putative n=1 Tax=Plasmodium chabaudi adami TaxID=5826 RepID=A0A1D3S2M6_PLACE|nr:protein phosphatase PP2A regulatory subunit A, putative [Plasmodium chabaudi adami]
MMSEKGEEILNGIQSIDNKTRLKYMKELKELCKIIKVEKTKEELIEFLYNMIEDDYDVLFELSKNLIYLTNFLSDTNSCYFLCDLILNFVIAYEKEININGYNAFKNYINKCDANTLTNIIYPKIINLSKDESDNYRIGGSKILHIIIDRCVCENQVTYIKTFINLFLDLCQDQSILVKKSCCDKFCKFLEILKRYRDCLYNSKCMLNGDRIIEDDTSFNKNNAYGGKNLKKNSNIQNAVKLKNGVNDDGFEKRESEDGKKKGKICIFTSGDKKNNYINGITTDTQNNVEDKASQNELNEIKINKFDENMYIFIEKTWERAQEIYCSFFYSMHGMDEVKISAISILSETLSIDNKFVKDVESILTNICNDESWRVRAILANNIHEILASQKDDKLSMLVLLLLLKDLDSNVRSIVLNNLDKIFLYTKINVNILDEIYEDLKRDIDSNNIHLKISLCRLLCSLPDILDKNGSIEYILPLLLLFIRIEESNLKSDLFICLHKISNIISYFDMKQIIIPLYQEIAKSKNWRLRFSLYHYLKFFDNFFLYQNKENISSNYLHFWNYIYTGAKDVSYSIRMEVLETLNFLIKNNTFTFFESGVTYLLNNLKESKNYIFRVTCLQYIANLIIYFPLQYIEENILKIIEFLSNDKISNIRYNIVKTIYYVKKYINHVLMIIKNDTYAQIISTARELIDRRNRENKLNSDADGKKENNELINGISNSNNNEYFQKLERKYNLFPNKENDVDNSYFINSTSASSYYYYDNMKNTDVNKKRCENILKFLSDKLILFISDTDQDVSKASNSLIKDEFFFYISSVNTFNSICRPIK